MRFLTTLVLALLLAGVVALIHWFGEEPTPEPTSADPLLPGINPSTITRFELTRYPHRKAILEKQAGNRWRLVAPFRDDVRDDRIVQLMEVLTRNPRTSIPLSAAERGLSSKGLDPPEFTLCFFDQRGAHTLYIGARDPFKSECYVMIEGDDTLYRTGSNLRNLMELNPENLRDDRIFRIDPLLVKEIVLEGPGGLIMQAEKRTALWEITAPRRVDSDSGRIQSLVSRLSALRVQSRLPENPAEEGVAAAYGFDGEVFRITLRSGPVSRQVIIEPRGMGPHGDFLCIRDGDDSLSTIEGSDFQRLLKAFHLNSYRSRELLRVVRNLVATLRIRRQGELALEIKRTPDGKFFEITHPFKAPADNVPDGNETLVYRFLVRLDGIRIDGETGFVADGVEDLKPYGLDPPDLEMEVIWKEGGSIKSARLLFSKQDGSGRVYAARKGRSGPVSVFRVKALDLEPFHQDAILLRDRRVFPQKGDLAKVRSATFTRGEAACTITRDSEGYFKDDRNSRFQVFLNEMVRTRVIRYEASPSLEGDERFEPLEGSIRLELEGKKGGETTLLYAFGVRAADGWYGRSSELPMGVFYLEDVFIEQFRKLFKGL